MAVLMRSLWYLFWMLCGLKSAGFLPPFLRSAAINANQVGFRLLATFFFAQEGGSHIQHVLIVLNCIIFEGARGV